MKRILFLVLVAVSANGYADQFHYNNFIMGDRAVGMGGAYAGVSDDASGVIYNPAGLAFALSNDISGSANAFYDRNVKYKEAVCGTDFEENSGGSVPAFFGGLQKLDRHVKGLVFAFGVYTVDSELKDQDTLISDATCGSVEISRYHRTSNHRSSTVYYGGAVGYRVSPNFSVGFGLNYFSIDELVQEYQDAKQNTVSNPDTWRILSQNVRQRLTGFGIEPVLGVQYAFGGSFSVGATLKYGMLLGQEMEISTENRQIFLTKENLDKVEASDLSNAGVIAESINNEKNDKPLGGWPTSLRVGFAWFINTKSLFTLDLTHSTAVNNAGEIAAFGKPIYNREAVTNLASGFEYYMLPAFPLRVGLFTNNDARPKINEGTPNSDAGITCTGTSDAAKAFAEKYCGQPDHVDYIGESIYLAWVQPNSQIAAGVVLQQGSGKSQKTGDHQVQDVEASSLTFGFSATHNF